MKKIVETERLYLGEFKIEDAQLLIDLNSDPEITRYTPDGPVKNLEEAKRILTDIIFPQYLNKMGRWAIHLKANDDFIGWCGLKYILDTGEIHLGYRFFKKYWNQGYATEAAKAVMNYGIKTLKLKNIIAIAAKENVASINVIKKLEMVYLEDDISQPYIAEKYIRKI